MNVLSLFDGMSCGQLALQHAEINYDRYFASEIDKYAIKVTMTNFPNTIQLGDVTKIDAQELPKIDLILAGSPCQGFSFAGRGLAFNDPHSKLFFEFIRILRACKPKWFLLENVVMKKEYENIITDFLGVKPVMINSNLVSAQNRKRLYWTNIPDIIQPEDRGVVWGDVRERGVEWGSVYYSKKALEWIKYHGCRYNKQLKVHQDNEKFCMLEASGYKKYSSQRFFGIIDYPGRVVFIPAPGKYLDVYKQLEEGFHYRYLTPRECERLQTVPDDYTSYVSNTQRYKMLGNGWTVYVIAHILRFIPL